MLRPSTDQRGTMSLASAKVIWVGVPPAAGMMKMCEWPWMRESKRMSIPDGDQDGLPEPESSPPAGVSCLRDWPLMEESQICWLPERQDWNASCEPSGEMLG